MVGYSVEGDNGMKRTRVPKPKKTIEDRIGYLFAEVQETRQSLDVQEDKNKRKKEARQRLIQWVNLSTSLVTSIIEILLKLFY